METLNLKEIATTALNKMKSVGIEKSHVVVRETTTSEFDLQSQGIQLFRTTFDHALNLRGIRNSRQAKASGNDLSMEGIQNTVSSLPELIDASPTDEAYDISDVALNKEFVETGKSTDLEKMLNRVTDFIKWSRSTFPQVVYESSQFKYIEVREVVLNSNGLKLEHNYNTIKSNLFFTAKEGKNASSFEGVEYIENELGGPLQLYAGAEELLRGAVSHLHPRNIAEKFSGDVIMSPFFVGDFLTSAITSQLTTSSLMSGQSLFQKSMGKKVFSEKFSLSSDPLDKKFAQHQPFTSDGYLTSPMKVVEDGVLKNYLLGQYGAKKLNLTRSTTDGSHLFVKNGDLPKAKMIENVKRGILLTRLSGGNPSPNGDFSGIAKNSFYIENGKIAYPVKEVMLSGNYLAMLNDIKGISKETIQFGTSEFPWIHCGGATIA